MLKELPKGKIKTIAANDYDPKAFQAIKNNLRLNKIRSGDTIRISCQDASLFLLSSFGFDFIDIDPFGTPNPFLDAAAKRLSRGGILAVTATDTAALAGTSPDACLRKYWAVPRRGSSQHEIGLRILIRKIQLVGAQYEKGLIPVFSYSKEHYLRVFLQCTKGKKFVDKLLKSHGMFKNAGPLWLGNLWDPGLVKSMASSSLQKNFSKEFGALMRLIEGESQVPSAGVFSIHEACERLRLKAVPRTESILESIHKSGNAAARTHFIDDGVRTPIKVEDFENVLKKLANGHEHQRKD